MIWFRVLGIAVAVGMDAFAVAVVAGLSLEDITKRHLFRLSFHFGLFQAGMLTIGWFIGHSLYALVAPFAHWVAFAMLVLVGGNILRHAFRGASETRIAQDPTSGWQLVFLSFATSIDSLVVGLSVAMIGVSIAVSASVVGLVAAALTLLGMPLGNRASVLWGKRMEVVGGLILIAIGFTSLWDHFKV